MKVSRRSQSPGQRKGPLPISARQGAHTKLYPAYFKHSAFVPLQSIEKPVPSLILKSASKCSRSKFSLQKHLPDETARLWGNVKAGNQARGTVTSESYAVYQELCLSIVCTHRCKL